MYATLSIPPVGMVPHECANMRGILLGRPTNAHKINDRIPRIMAENAPLKLLAYLSITLWYLLALMSLWAECACNAYSLEWNKDHQKDGQNIGT
jgi:hypothetical protein